jgi:hypothetical protein
MGKNIKRLRYQYNYDGKNLVAELEIDLGRFEGQFSKAQYILDSTVMTDMVPYMPMDTGQFINVTKAMSASIAGSGKVVAAAPPFGRFLYNGLVMVDEATGSPYARKGAKKVLVSEFGGLTSAPQKLNFSKSAHPKATDHWFEAAKKEHGKQWIDIVKKNAGGGK